MSGQGRQKTCFVIAPIGGEGTEIRKRSDQVLEHVITQVTDALGYKTIRADKLSQPGLITSQIIQHLVNDDLVIADLAGHNPNVFYELGIRHVLKKPVIQLTEKGQSIPFDVAQLRTIELDYHDLSSAAYCRRELEKQVKAVEAKPNDVQTPVSIAVGLKWLSESSNPTEKSAGQILTELQNLRARTDEIYKALRPDAHRPEYYRGLGVSGVVQEVYEKLEESEQRQEILQSNLLKLQTENARLTDNNKKLIETLRKMEKTK